MKKKTLQTISTIGVVGTCILIPFIVLMLVLRADGYFDKFNPVEDVCLKQNCVRCEGHNSYESSCAEWRPKTICEKDPDAEGCVCDETFSFNSDNFTMGGYTCLQHQFVNKSGVVYMRETCWNMICYPLESLKVISKVCTKSHLPPTPIKLDPEKEKCVEWIKDSEDYITTHDNNYKMVCRKSNVDHGYISQNLYDKYCCIRKEPKNPCERGEEGWIKENDSCNISPDKVGVCAVGECRKKTIQDITCTELGKKLFFREGIQISSNGRCEEGEMVFFTGPFDCYKIYSAEQVYDEYQRRCRGH